MESPSLIRLLVLVVAMLVLSDCNGDDDDSSTEDAGDDNDVSTDDDDDNDNNDDNDDNDDDASPSPYDGMTPSGPTINETLAIASHMSTGAEYDAAREFEIQRCVEAGVSYSRRGFYWPSIEPADDVWTFEGYDEMVDRLTGAGIQPTAFLSRAVAWAAPGGPNEIDPADWADFAGTVAARYAGRVPRYEIWNEENSSAFWDSPDPAKYGDLLKAAFTAIHAADDAATVMMGGLSPFDPHLFDPRGIWNFIYRVGQAHPDICQYMDAIAIHPYTFLQQPGPEFALDLGVYHYPDLRGNVEEARGLLAEIGCAEKPIHLTEIGWPDLFIGVDRQGAYLARSVMLARAAGAASCYWYTFFNENDAADIDFPTDGWFGLYTNPDLGDPEVKPSYQALYGAHLAIGAARYAGDLGAALKWDDDNYALAFADDQGGWTIGLWHVALELDEEATVDVPLPPDVAGSWSLLDQNGQIVQQGDAADGAVTVALGGRVQYLKVAGR